MQNNFKIILISLITSSSLLLGCESFDKLREPKPLEGKNVNVYSLGDGQVDFRLKVSGLTSTLWVTTELVNNSTETVNFQTPKLLQFEDPTCLENQDFEKPRTEILAPNERQLVRYTFRLYAAQKHSPQYERCKAQPLKFTVSGVQLAGKELPLKSLTIQSE